MINNENIKSIIGTSVKELRTKRGITQEKLAEHIGVQPQTIAKIETGKRYVSSTVLAKLCNFFNVEPYIFFLKKAQTYTPETVDLIGQINHKLEEIHNILIAKNT